MIKNRGAVELLSSNKIGKDKFGHPGWGQPIKYSHNVAVVQSVTFHEMYGGGKVVNAKLYLPGWVCVPCVIVVRVVCVYVGCS